jgi:predicted dehydrogenase
MSATPQATRTTNTGRTFPVEVATHVTGVLEHAGGALSTLLMSFDVWAAQLPRIEVYGTGGSLSVPDPNGFHGQARIFRAGGESWADLPESGGYPNAARGYGLADLARAIRTGGQPRASGDLAFHVLDVMESLLTAAETGTSITITSDVARPAPVPLGARPEEV